MSENPVPTSSDATAGAPVGAAPGAVAEGPLPRIATRQSAEEIVRKLRTASQRGRLPGFASPDREGLLRVAAFGSPFDAELLGTLGPGGLEFRIRRSWKLPLVFAVVLVATVWPGVLFMDKLIPGEWGWIPTWWWYVPLTAIPAPLAWREAMRRSRASTARSAREMIAKIAAELGEPAAA